MLHGGLDGLSKNGKGLEQRGEDPSWKGVDKSKGDVKQRGCLRSGKTYLGAGIEDAEKGEGTVGPSWR